MFGRFVELVLIEECPTRRVFNAPAQYVLKTLRVLEVGARLQAIARALMLRNSRPESERQLAPHSRIALLRAFGSYGRLQTNPRCNNRLATTFSV